MIGDHGQEILLVEDNPGDARLIREMLVDEMGNTSFRMRSAASVEQALEALGQYKIGIILLDLSLPDSLGLETFERIQLTATNIPIIVLTGNQDQELALSAVKAGAQDYLVKNDLTGSLLLKTMQYASERKQIEASLRVSEARFRSLADLSSDWYWEQDRDGRLTYVSGGLKEKTGIDSNVLLGNCWWDVAGFAPRNGWGTHLKTIATRSSFKDLVVEMKVDGTESIYLSISGEPVISENADFEGYRGVGKDVTARERIDADLRGSEERYRKMMDTARDGIVMINSDGLVSFSNVRVSNMLGYDSKEILDRPLLQFIDSTNAIDAIPADIIQAPGSEAVCYTRKDGERVWVMQASYPVTGRDGVPAGSLVILTSLTEFRQRDERIRQLAALAAQKSEAERANLAKSRFLAAVSHDLRQPMHALSLFIGDLKDINLPAGARDLIGNMESALDLTNSLLDALLVMSRLESGMVVPSVISFPIQPILDRIEVTFAQAANLKNIELRVVQSNAIVTSDPTLFERIVANLVSNAIRYTDRGGVVLGCRRRGNLLSVEVWDSGIGIPPEYQQAIFREFFRIETEGQSRGGLGLGLAIVESSARLLAHEVRLASVQGKGSRFSVSVPLAQVAQVSSSKNLVDFDEDDLSEGQCDFHGLAALVVDDDPVILDRTSALLSRWGLTVLRASSIDEVSVVLDQHPTGIDFAISDLRLKNSETGFDVVRLARMKYGPKFPAIIVTGDTSLTTSREIKRYGLPCLYKPVPIGRLRILIERIVARTT